MNVKSNINTSNTSTITTHIKSNKAAFIKNNIVDNLIQTKLVDILQ
jgi:hypothetical protein